MAFKAGAIYGEAILDTSKWESGVKKLGKSALNVGKVAAAAFVGAMTVSIAAANEFQKSMSNVATVIDTSVVSTQDMTKQLLVMDPALGKTKELTDALYQSFSAGAEDAEEAMETTTAAAKFAGAALTDTATAVDVLTTASNAYGKEVVSTTEASDIFFTTIKQGKITGEELSSSIGKSIPLFASLNIPLEELGSGMAAMTKQGVNASEATTQLNGIVNSFLKPSADMAAALEAQGYASGSALLETEGLSGALDFLETASGGSKDELSKLLPSIEAVRGTLALTGTGGEEFAKILLEMEDAAGATDEAFGKQEKTFETFKNQMDKVSIVVGNVGKYFVDDLAGGATDAAGAVLTFITSSSGMELIGNIVGAVAGTFELLKTIVSPLVDLMKDHFVAVIETAQEELEELGIIGGEGAGAFDILGYVVAGVTSVFRVASVSTLEFIGFLGNLVTAVMASGATVGTFFKFLTGKAEWDEVKANATLAKDAFTELATGVGDSFSAIAETVVTEAQAFTEQGKENAREFESTFTLAFDNSKTNVLENFDEMITGQKGLAETMAETNQGLVDKMNSQNDELEEDTEDTTKSMASAWDQYFVDVEVGLETVVDTAITAFSTGFDALSTLSDLFYGNELDNITIWKNDELKVLDDRFKNGEISKELYDLKLAELDEEALRKSNAIAKKQFENNKAASIANVWIDAAASIMGWWANAPMLGPIAGPIFGGVMTGVTLGVAIAQTVGIAGQQFIPARERGGMASGPTRIHEAGGEIVTLPDGSQVIPNDISKQIASASGGDTINVSFAGANISSDMDLRRVADEVSRILGRQLRNAG